MMRIDPLRILKALTLMVSLKEQIMSDSTQHDDAEELFRHRHDPEEWETEEEVIEVRPTRTSVVSFRVPSEEMEWLERAAKEAGQTLSEFIRAALALLRHVQRSTLATYNLSYGSQGVPQRDEWSTWTTALATTTEDIPESMIVKS